MKFICSLFITLCISAAIHAQYNPLWIPDTLSGTTFNLTLKDSTKQFLAGTPTATAGINNAFWGPTLFINKGDSVHMNVNNQLNDTTTIHWHGMHLPPVMDGGPHQPVPPSTVWSPYWKMDNNAGTYWYHPHLHMMAVHQITTGLGGLLIVRDSIESSLSLPRTYGVDDIPLVLTDRRFNPNNQFLDVTYGDTMMVNGTLNAETTVPAQVVRFRILNAALERCYRIGFADNRTFYVITSDGGLLDQPVPVTQYLLCAAERIEILADFTSQNGQSVNMRAFNLNLPPAIPGFEQNAGPGPLANALGNRDFDILHLNIGAVTSNPITTIPANLVANSLIDTATATVLREISIIDTMINGAANFALNHRTFDINYNDYNVTLNNTEIWSVTNTSVIAHPFHIHDIEFNLLDRNGNTPPLAERGWKDVVLVRRNETIRFIGRFTDFADSLHPFMFHCHIAAHEDAGLMGQFIVTELPDGINSVEDESLFTVYPNPSSENLNIMMKSNVPENSSLNIYDPLGRIIYSKLIFAGNSIVVPLHSISAGEYILSLITANGVYRKKILISR